MSGKDLPVPSLEQVCKSAPILTLWTDMAVSAYALYAGANEAIKLAQDKSNDSALMADQIRQQSALMTVIRCFALLDRCTELSFQSVYRFLKCDDAFEGLATNYALVPPVCAKETAEKECRAAIDKFLSAYSEIDFSTLSRLQSFRNKAIAHIAWEETEKFVTYGELEKLMRICSALAHQLNLMTSGLNNCPWEHYEATYDQAFNFWSATIRDDPDPFLMISE